jgi:hypothetical protein
MAIPAVLPSVSGPHRNRALAAAPRVRAIELRTAGLTYQEIADQLGYRNRGAVYNIIAAALKARTADAVDDLQHLEGARLDALQQALWAKAMEGDLPAVAAIVRIIQARCRLYGLTGKTTPMPPSATAPTVVLSPEEVTELRS